MTLFEEQTEGVLRLCDRHQGVKAIVVICIVLGMVWLFRKAVQ